MKYLASLLLLLLSSPPTLLIALPYYYFDKPAITAYQHIINGRIPLAEQQITSLKTDQPENLIAVFLQDYTAWMRLFLLENKNDYTRYLKLNLEAITLLEKGDMASPFHRYCQGKIYLHRAFAQLLFADYLPAYWNMRKAYLLLSDNKKLFPSFLANEKDMALIETLTGMLPESYHWMIRLTGLPTNKQKAVETLLRIINQTNESNFTFYQETLLTYGLIIFYLENEKQQAIDLFRKHRFPSPTDLTGNLVFLNMLLHARQNDSCQLILTHFPRGNEYLHVPLLHYYKGLCLLQQLHPDAVQYFEKYIAETQSPHLIKSAYHKAGWAWLVKGDKTKYAWYMTKVLQEGIAHRESDKQALREATLKDVPHTDILKARLLFDGGYMQHALQLLQAIDEQQLSSERDKIELTYRKARVYDCLKDTLQAIHAYMETIHKGQNMPYYFAASAAMHLAAYYEKRGSIDQARRYYELCLQLNNHEYAWSISQKARSGLQRLK